MSIYKKLFEAKKEIGKISKDSKNPFFKSKYFDVNSLLEHVEPILQKHGLLLLQPIKDNKVVTLIQDIDIEDKNTSGQFISSEILLPSLNDPQKLGSAITYYRRYTLQSLLGLQAEDDDGNLASKPTSINYTRQNNMLKACTTLEQLATIFKGFTSAEQKGTVTVKDEMKLKLK